MVGPGLASLSLTGLLRTSTGSHIPNREGSDHIKLLIDDGSLFGLDVPTLSPTQVRALVTATHRRGKQAVAHAFELEHATTAVTAGVDGLVHVVSDTVVGDTCPRRNFRR